ncbi:MAG TPA: glutamate-5-semialdehyde dehydrogenase [Syntrophomonadaceae bacterium]|nr:glutamate-5-semialdehyde dehydrogenase [Syntrophomonadaceae bacterium]HPR92478.1 glutamate-5-semialdehyde dehydrogenase [Syntrophomonadaceae bacterium]
MSGYGQNYLIEQGKMARQAARILAVADTKQKNNALIKMSDSLEKAGDEIIAANSIDLKSGQEMGLSAALLERLSLDKGRVAAMAEGLREISLLPDPVGEVLEINRRPNGLEVGRIRTPIGVIGIIYESRPNVTADAAGLCLKSGNAILLRGGEEALNSNRVIARVIAEAAMASGLPVGTIQLVDSPDRQLVIQMMQMNDYLDCLIPRGGLGLKKTVMANASVPYIMTGMGNCHVYVDQYADLNKARPIVINAKVQRPSVCNAIENLLVHESIAAEFLPLIAEELKQAGVEIRGCPASKAIVPWVKDAVEADWDEEYLDLIIAVKVVRDLDEAIDHINTHGTGHSEAIISESYTNVRRFMNAVDAAAVYANASTRFTDGNEFGFGAEMGISTQKLHARGPMGLRELTTTKFIIYGDGQIR